MSIKKLVKSAFRELKHFLGYLLSLICGRNVNYRLPYDDPIIFPQLLCFSLFIKKGDTVLDIGANIGYYSAIFHNIVGPTGTIIGFEPNIIANRILNNNMKRSHINNVKTYRLALSSDSDKITKIHIDPLSYSAFSTIEPKFRKYLKSYFAININTKTARLDDFLYSNGDFKIGDDMYCPPSFVKIDVEGHETEVLKGARTFLNKYKPVVMLEYKYIDEYFEPRSLKILQDEGYLLFDLLTFKEVNEHYRVRETNILALPHEKYEYVRTTFEFLSSK
jgi:FkbM family methyltransferase